MNINGITPVIVDSDYLVIDKSGNFSLDESIWATIYLVGGGCDGSDGFYDERNKIVHGGAGGDGGNVYKFGKIVLFKDIEYPVQIAESNDKDGTAITIRGKKYTCGDMGKYSCDGGTGSLINSQKSMICSQNGVTGIPSPIGYVGSSGGGGCAVYKNFSATFGNGGTGAGSGRPIYYNNVSDGLQDNIFKQINAKNYGCGGGGNTFCYNCTEFEDIELKSKGNGGCVIIVYEPYDENFPDLTVRYWGNTKRSRDVEIRNLRYRYEEILAKNKELKEKFSQIETEN